MADILEQNISTALKAIAEAIKLDSGNKHVEAYWQYLQSITFIIQSLTRDFHQKGLHNFHATNMTKKFVKLAQQSIERLGAVVENVSSGPSQKASTERLTSPMDASPKMLPSPSMDLPISGQPTAAWRKDLSPMEQAQLMNQQLVANYRARIAKMSSPSDRRATDMSLTLQRKLIENASIAKARQAAVERKLKARRRTLEQEAAKRLSSRDDQEFFVSVLKYEQERKWPLAWRERITKNSKDARLITLLVNHILSAKDHPITKELSKYQYAIYKKIKPLIEEHVKSVNSIVVPYDSTSSSPISGDQELKFNVESPTDVSSQGGRVRTRSLSGDSWAEIEYNPEVFEENIDFVSTTSDVKHQIEKAIGRGKKLMKKFSQDLTSGDKETKFSSAGMGSADVDEFDDLFEEIGMDNTDGARSRTEEEGENLSVSGGAGEIQTVTEESCAEEKHGANGETVGSSAKEKLSSTKEDAEVAESLPETSTEETAAENTDSETEDLEHPSSETEGMMNPDSATQLVSDDPLTKTESTKDYPDGAPKEDADRGLSDSSEEEPISFSASGQFSSLYQSVTKDVHSYLNKLLRLFIIAYEELDTSVGRDQLYVTLEDPFFKELWPHLLLFFRVVHLEKERELAKIMTAMSECTPSDLGIQEKLCLTGHTQSYYPAIQELVQIKLFFSPLKKLQCLVNMSRSICQCVEDFCESTESEKGQGANLGADDLLPLISYVVIRSRMPQLFSECAALEEFIHHGYLYGEEGYCLTSMQTALAYIMTFKKRTTSTEGPPVT